MDEQSERERTVDKEMETIVLEHSMARKLFLNYLLRRIEAKVRNRWNERNVGKM
jgi:hypothetical protein